MMKELLLCWLFSATSISVTFAEFIMIFFLHRTTHATSVISFTARTVVLLMRVILPTFYESSKSSVVNCGVGFALQERILAYLTYTLASHRKAFFEVPTLPKIESMPCGFPHDLVAMLHA